jgi:hypothetical protein
MSRVSRCEEEDFIAGHRWRQCATEWLTPWHGMGRGMAGVRRGVGGNVRRPSSQWREAAAPASV